MATFLLPLVVLLLVGGLASAWLFKVRERREQVSTGLMALSSMHWRELQRLVVAAMRQRGFQPHVNADTREEDGLVALAQGRDTWLLSTKHGTAYVLGTAAVGEFANTMQLHNAQGGVMATVGEAASDTRSLARTQRIELLDGASLWAEICPLLEPEQRNLILGEVHARTKRHAMMAWGMALVAAALVFVLQPRSAPGNVVQDTNAGNTPASRATASASASASASTAPKAPDNAIAANETVPEDPAALAERRNNLVRAIGTLPWVGRAMWSTQSTLVIDLQAGAAADKAALCELVESYPELRASRLQVQPPRDSTLPVRFMQCRVY